MFRGFYKFRRKPFYWTVNEGAGPVNFTVCSPNWMGNARWFFYVYAFGHRWSRG